MDWKLNYVNRIIDIWDKESVFVTLCIFISVDNFIPSYLCSSIIFYSLPCPLNVFRLFEQIYLDLPSYVILSVVMEKIRINTQSHLTALFCSYGSWRFHWRSIKHWKSDWIFECFLNLLSFTILTFKAGIMSTVQLTWMLAMNIK